MGKVLGLVGSHRRHGNSEVMACAALKAAQAEGAEISLLRLTDLDVRPCTGCMACVYKGGCPIDDDAAFLFREIQAVQGLVVAAPTYILGPTAVVKLILDRVLMLWAQGGLGRSFPAASIATAGLSGWDTLSIQVLNQFILALGGQVMGSMVAYGPGPGHSLLDPANVSRAQELGRAVARGVPLPAPRNACPVCHGTAFVPAGAGKVACGLCQVEGTLREGPDGVEVTFGPEAARGHRWTPEALAHHFLDWIIPTRERFLVDRDAIRQARKPYDDMHGLWVEVPRRTTGAVGE